MFKPNIWTHGELVLRPTTSGLSVYGLASEDLVSFIPTSTSVTSVWANDQYVYIGTSSSGVCYCPTSTVTASGSFVSYKQYPELTNNTVNYLHGKGDYLCVTTISGVDRYKISTDDREYTLRDNPHKCFQTTNGDYYYIKNPDYVVTGLNDSLFGWAYMRKITLSKPIPEDNYQLFIELATDNRTSFYKYARKNGGDVRILSDGGVVLPYFIESWDYINPPTLYVNLPKDTESFSILYGNDITTPASDGDATFRLFDHFEGTELDTNKWTFSDGGYASNTYYVEDSQFIFDSFSHSYTVSLTSKETFTGCVVEHSFKTILNGAYNTDLDYTSGFADNGTYAYIGCVSGTDEFPHYLVSNSDQGNIYGNKFTSSALKVMTVVESLYYQASEYDGELLQSSGTLTTVVDRPIFMSYSNYWYQPDIVIDWVRVRVYDSDPPSYTIGDQQLVRDEFPSPELHAVYDSGGGFVYNSSTDNVLDASYLSDLYITEGTSIHAGENVIFLATTWGANVIEEYRGFETDCRKRVYLIET